MTAGRICPLHYRYSPRQMARKPAFATDTLYVVGGLYGNLEALDAVEALAQQEPGARIVFNGDCHWFDRDPDVFAAIQDRVLAHELTAGNVEVELAEPSSAGCGCAYPDYVAEAAVAHSNAIMDELKAICSGARASELCGLPRTLTVEVGDRRIGIVHGDPTSLAGWGLAAEAVPPADPSLQAALGCGDEVLTPTGRLAEWFRDAEVDAFASTHTCLPVLTDVDVDGGRRALINNGSAGMPNFRGTRYGLATRIGTVAHPDAVARLHLDGIVLEFMALAFDPQAWWARFSAWWDEGSPAWVNYAARLGGDLAYTAPQAVRGSAQWLRDSTG